MSRLVLYLFGPFRAVLDDVPLLEFLSNKSRALLAYLATEPTRLHHRSTLATLLWPHMSDAAALRNLRYAIADLRRRLGDTTAQAPFLLVTRHTIELNPGADISADVMIFREHMSVLTSRPRTETRLASLEAALALYQGEFMQGFQVRECPSWEEWLLLRREEFVCDVVRALRDLARAYEQQGRHEKARVYAQRWLRYVPWDEEAHVVLIRLLARSGQRAAALAQYDQCREALARELGIEPAPQTQVLVQAILEGRYPRFGWEDGLTL